MDYLLVSVIQFILWPVKIKVSKHFVAFPSIDFHLSNIVGCFSLITHHIWNSLVDGSVHLKSVNSTKFAQTTNYTVQTLQTVLYKHRLFYIILCPFFWVCALWTVLNIQWWVWVWVSPLHFIWCVIVISLSYTICAHVASSFMSIIIGIYRKYFHNV